VPHSRSIWPSQFQSQLPLGTGVSRNSLLGERPEAQAPMPLGVEFSCCTGGGKSLPHYHGALPPAINAITTATTIVSECALKKANHEFKAVLNRWETAYNKENYYRGIRILLELQRNGSSKL
jgi:hypothetical protein